MNYFLILMLVQLCTSPSFHRLVRLSAAIFQVAKIRRQDSEQQATSIPFYFFIFYKYEWDLKKKRTKWALFKQTSKKCLPMSLSFILQSIICVLIQSVIKICIWTVILGCVLVIVNITLGGNPEHYSRIHPEMGLNVFDALSINCWLWNLARPKWARPAPDSIGRSC